MRYVRKKPDCYAVQFLHLNHITKEPVFDSRSCCEVMDMMIDRARKTFPDQTGALWVSDSTLKLKMDFGIVEVQPGNYIVYQNVDKPGLRVMPAHLFDKDYEPEKIGGMSL